MFKQRPSRIIVIALVAIFLAALTVNANWGSGFGLNFFVPKEATVASGRAPAIASPAPTNTATDTPTATPTPCGVTFSYTGPAVLIPDNTPTGVNFTIPVSGVGTISDLNFSFDGI